VERWKSMYGKTLGDLALIWERRGTQSTCRCQTYFNIFMYSSTPPITCSNKHPNLRLNRLALFPKFNPQYSSEALRCYQGRLANIDTALDHHGNSLDEQAHTISDYGNALEDHGKLLSKGVLDSGKWSVLPHLRRLVDIREVVAA
jgi:hypothetical protein